MKKSAAWIAVVAALLVLVLLVRHFSADRHGSARAELLRLIPADATTVVFVDFEELRSSPFLSKLYSWSPVPAQDAEYTQFVKETNFNYERDLNQVVIAISAHGSLSNTLLIADGKFDRARIEAFLNRTGKATQQAGLRVFALPASSRNKPIALAFPSAQRFALTNADNASTVLSSIAKQPGLPEWQTRFDRLAGTPVFAVIRQDPAMQAALSAATPGGFRSPQLAALLNQLQWISVAGKPDGELLRVVAEGECPSDLVATQLRDFLQGILLLAQNGLNDPKLRQQMNPDERQAYLELLKTADIAKINRGDSKSVRLVLSVTPQFLAVAETLRTPAADPPSASPAKSAALVKSKTAKAK